MAAVDDNQRYRAPALDKGLDILELLAASDEGLSQAEIANAMDRTTNEIYRMLDRLVRRQYVTRTASDRYELTLKLYALAHQRPPLRRLVSLATPVMRRITQSAEQSCHLVVLERGSLIIIAQVDAPGYWELSVRVGSRIGLVNTGSGHVLLAFADEAERQLMLEEHEPVGREVAPDDLDERLKLIRERGYEIMDSKQTLGVMNLSVPVLGPREAVLAVMTSPFIKRLDTTEAPCPNQVIELLKAGCADLSKLISSPA